ncbi:MAG: lipopolysaccharide biosynthesis protein [Flavobacteriales bacterium]
MFKLVLGTASGQAIALGLSFIVTRIYDPSMFATLEQFAMILGVLGAVAGGKYELTIMLADKKETAFRLLRSTIHISLLVAVITSVLGLLFKSQVAHLLGNSKIENLLWLIGPALFCFVVTTALGYWFGRHKRFGPAATSKTLFSSVSEPLKIGFGKLNLIPSGLLYGVTLGHLFSSVFMWFKLDKNEQKGLLKKNPSKAHLKEFSNYPKLILPGSLLNRLAQWLHIALFGLLYGEIGLVAVGILGLCRRVLMQPLNIFSNSFAQVYYQKLTEKSGGQLKGFYMKMLGMFSAVSLFMIALIWILPDNTMSFFFGEEWLKVMEYLRILIFWFATNFTVGSLGFVLHRIQAQKKLLVLDACHLFFVLFAMLLAYILEFDIKGALIAFVVAKVLYLIVNVLTTYYSLNRNILK